MFVIDSLEIFNFQKFESTNLDIISSTEFCIFYLNLNLRPTGNFTQSRWLLQNIKLYHMLKHVVICYEELMITETIDSTTYS
jgi:hypothetical protein